MKNIISNLNLLLITAVFLVGCAKHELDCKNPRNGEEKQECARKAHESAIRSVGPDTLPTNNKKW